MGWLNDAVARIWQAGHSARALVPFRPQAAHLTTPNDFGPRIVFMPRTPAGTFITPDDALKISTVWACVNVISKALASSAWEVFEEEPNGDRELRRDVRLWRMLNVRPNPEMTAFAFRETALIQTLLWGNFYAEIERSTRGEPLALWPLNPERVCLEREPDSVGRLVVRVHNQFAQDAILPYRDVYHLHGPSIDGIQGLETWAYAARTMGHAAALSIFGSSFFGNNAQVSGIIKPDTSLSVDTVNEIIAGLQQRHVGPDKAHQFLVLRGGLSFEKLTTDPESAQFIESNYLLVEEICRWFGVPPHKIAHLLRATFSNIEEQNIEFARDALTPWAERMRQEADAKLLPFGNRLLRTRFDLDWLTEGKAQEVADADAKLVVNGIKSRNEVRRKRGLNSIGEQGDLFTVQQQNVSLKRLANQSDEPEPPIDMREQFPGQQPEGQDDAPTDSA